MASEVTVPVAKAQGQSCDPLVTLTGTGTRFRRNN